MSKSHPELLHLGEDIRNFQAGVESLCQQLLSALDGVQQCRPHVARNDRPAAAMGIVGAQSMTEFHQVKQDRLLSQIDAKASLFSELAKKYGFDAAPINAVLANPKSADIDAARGVVNAVLRRSKTSMPPASTVVAANESKHTQSPRREVKRKQWTTTTLMAGVVDARKKNPNATIKEIAVHIKCDPSILYKRRNESTELDRLLKGNVSEGRSIQRQARADSKSRRLSREKLSRDEDSDFVH